MESWLTPKMIELIEAGIDILYTARDGKKWLISEMENGTFVIFDGQVPMFGYPSLSIAQEAIETGSIYWHGEGWYCPVAFNWQSERIWCCTPEEVDQLDIDTKKRFPDRPSGVKYCGDEDKPDNPYDSIRDLLD